MLYDGLEAMDMSMLVAPEHRLASLTTVCAPAGVDEMAVRKHLLTEYNIEIAGGLGVFKGTCWRVGLMGYSARPENVVTLLGALGRVLWASVDCGHVRRCEARLVCPASAQAEQAGDLAGPAQTRIIERQ